MIAVAIVVTLGPIVTIKTVIIGVVRHLDVTVVSDARANRNNWDTHRRNMSPELLGLSKSCLDFLRTISKKIT